MTVSTLFTIASRDGFRLACTRISPLLQKSQTASNQPVILLAPATGVPRSFYTSFLQYLAKEGDTTVFSFDYRLTGGKGGSWSSSTETVDSSNAEDRKRALIEGKETTISQHWKQDYEAVLHHVLDFAANRKVAIIGHSLGGHLLQLIDPRLAARVTRALWVGVVNPHVNFDIRAPDRTARANNLIAASKSAGFFPSSSIDLGHDIPSGTGEQWFNWSLSPQYMGDQQSSLDKFMTPVFSVAFNDDALCLSDKLGSGNPRVWDDILSYIPAPATRVIFDPTSMNWGEVGHVNAFQQRHERTVWPIFLNYVMKGDMRTEGGEVKKFREVVESRESRL